MSTAVADVIQAPILEHSRVGKLLERYPSEEERLRKAAEWLEFEYPDASSARKIAALEKTARTFQSGKIKVFLSYKVAEAETARLVRHQLLKHAPNTLQICWSEEFRKGDVWRDKIVKKIKPANWFLLLLPDPKLDWDWCLYEAGIFRGARLLGDRLICIHHPKIELPEQLADFQAVPASNPEMEKLLKDIFLRKDAAPGMEPINPHAKEDIADIAETICAKINPPRGERTHFEHYVILEVDDPSALEDAGDLEPARILHIGESTPRIFGFVKAPSTWGELVAKVTAGDRSSRWIEELCRSLRAAVGRELVDPINASFSAARNGKSFRPVVYSMEAPIDGARRCSFKVLFPEDVSPGPDDFLHVPKELTVLATALRLGYRFQWEVLERFGGDELEEEDVEILEDVLDRITAEADSRGFNDDPVLLFQQFRPQNAEKIESYFKRWYTMRNPEQTGTLDRALEEKDTERVREHLETLAPINQDFLVIVSKRFAERISTHLASEAGRA